MPIFEFETPAGRFQIDAPDERMAIEAFRNMDALPASGNSDAPRGGEASGVNEYANVGLGGLIEGVPVVGPIIRGGADRLGAGVRSLMSGNAYEDELKFVQEATGQLKERHPNVDTAAQIAGSIAGTVPMIAAAPAAFGVGAATRGGAMLASGASGAVLGGADAGVRSGGDVGAMASGAVVGGALGAASPIIAEGVGKAWEAAKNVRLPLSVRQAIGRASPDDAAMEIVADRLAKSGLTPAQVGRKMDRVQAAGTNAAAVDVMGPTGRDLLRTATNVPGKARDAATTKLTLRDMASGDRILKGAEQALSTPQTTPGTRISQAFDTLPPTGPAAGGTITASGYQGAKDAVTKARSTGSKAAYDEAYRGVVPFTQDLEKILSTPAGKAGLSAAKRNSANRREPWQQFFASVDDAGNITDMKRVPDVRALDEVKRVLDGMVEGAKKAADGSPFGKPLHTAESLAIQTVRDDLLKVMVKETGGDAGTYAKALQSGATNIQADKALEFGRGAMRMNPTQVALGLRGMNETEKGLARQGVMEAMRAEVHKSGDTHNVVLKLFGSKEKRNALRPFFPSSDAYNQFRTTLLNEARMRRTFDATRGNSTTVRQMMDMQDTGGVDLAKAFTTSVAGGPQAGLMSAGMDLLRGALNRTQGMTPEVAAKTSDLLLSRDPAKFRGLVDQLQRIETQRLDAGARLALQRQAIEKVLRPAVFGVGQSATQSLSTP